MVATYGKHAEAYARLVSSINRRRWWHCVPSDPGAYAKRGKFYATSLEAAQFYGTPGPPERVTVHRPLVIDNAGLESFLFGDRIPAELWDTLQGLGYSYEFRKSVDARLRDRAAERGFDSIALLSDAGFQRWLTTGRVPRSIELNVLHLSSARGPSKDGPQERTLLVFVPSNKYEIPEGYYHEAQFAELCASCGCHPSVVQFLCDMFGN